MKSLMNTPFERQIIPPLIKLLEHNGATYNIIVEIVTRESIGQPIDVQLLLARLVKEGYLNCISGIYTLNRTEENRPLFEEILQKS